MRFARPIFLALFGFVSLTLTAQGEDFPKSIVSWEPIDPLTVFRGEGGKAWDKKIRERGWIAFDGKTYHLWYTGYNEDRSPNRLLGHATSPDGLRWARDMANPIHDTSWVEDVCLVQKDGIDFLFAEGVNDRAHLLTSPDGIHWKDQGTLDVRTTQGRPIPPGPFGTPTALFEKGTWYLFYERGDRGVWLATSKDLKVWTNASDEPILKMGPELYDKYAVAFDQVFKRDGVFYAFYHANAHQPWKDWTTCVARSKDLVHWEKYPGNPILKEKNPSSAIMIETPEGDRLYSMHPDVRVYVHPKEKKN
jgi:hypothetical protein